MKIVVNNSELIFAKKQTLTITFTPHATWRDDGTWIVTSDTTTTTYKSYGANATLVSIEALQGFTMHFPAYFRLKFKYFDANGAIVRYDSGVDQDYANSSDVYSRAMARFASATVVSGKESVTSFAKLGIMLASNDQTSHPITQEICDAVYFD